MKDIIFYMFNRYKDFKYLGKIIVEKVPPKEHPEPVKPETLTGTTPFNVEKSETKTSAGSDSKETKESKPAQPASLHKSKKDDYIPKSIEFLTYS